MSIKSICLASSLVALTATAALADEPKPFNWSGFYAGAQIGTTVSGGSVFTYTEAGNFEPADRPRPVDMDGEILGGLHAGYLHQMGQLVVGIEGGAMIGGQSGKLSENPPPEGNDYQTTAEGGPIWVLTGRLGFAMDRALIYGKAGYALSDVVFNASFHNKDGEDGANGSVVAISHSYAMAGPVYGAGIEYAINDRISLGVEYLRFDFGPSGVADLATTNSGITSEKVRADHAIDTVAARLNFKF